MDPRQHDRYDRVIAKGEAWSTLWAFPEFQRWREEAVGAHLERLAKDALKADMSTEAGRSDAVAATIAHQQLTRLTDDLFKVSESAVEAARAALRKG